MSWLDRRVPVPPLRRELSPTQPEYSFEARVFLPFEENVMLRLNVVGAAVVGFTLAAGAAPIHASGHDRTLVVTMTNNPETNEINVYDADSRVLVQTLSTRGKGGVGGNARGIRQLDGTLVAAVNNGSQTVALF